jgi:hypothetical protein
MLGLLAILLGALAVGKLARRMTPAVELLLLLLVGVIVLAEYASWTATSRSGDLLLHWFHPRTH